MTISICSSYKQIKISPFGSYKKLKTPYNFHSDQPNENYSSGVIYIEQGGRKIKEL